MARDPQHLALLVVERRQAEHLHHAEQSAQRSADLVAHGGQERVLGPVRRQQLRGAFGHPVGQLRPLRLDLRIGPFQFAGGAAQLLQHLLALGDVAHGGGDHHAVRPPHRAQRDIHREDSAVFAYATEIVAMFRTAFCCPLPQRPHGAVEESLAQVAMLVRHIMRHQQIDHLSDQLDARVAEQFFGLTVDQRDDAFLIRHDDGVRREFEDLRELLFGTLALQLGRDAHGEQLEQVDHQLRTMQRPAIHHAEMPQHGAGRIMVRIGGITFDAVVDDQRVVRETL